MLNTLIPMDKRKEIIGWALGFVLAFTATCYFLGKVSPHSLYLIPLAALSWGIYSIHLPKNPLWGMLLPAQLTFVAIRHQELDPVWTLVITLLIGAFSLSFYFLKEEVQDTK